MYLDDFLVITSSFEEYQAALQHLISRLHALGFWITWHKVVRVILSERVLAFQVCRIVAVGEEFSFVRVTGDADLTQATAVQAFTYAQ